ALQRVQAEGPSARRLLVRSAAGARRPRLVLRTRSLAHHAFAARLADSDFGHRPPLSRLVRTDGAWADYLRLDARDDLSPPYAILLHLHRRVDRAREHHGLRNAERRSVFLRRPGRPGVALSAADGAAAGAATRSGHGLPGAG